MALDSRSDLDTLADSTFTTNGVGDISGAELNDGYKRLAASALIKNEAGDIGAGLAWASDVVRVAVAGVTLAMLANLAQATIIGRASGAGTGVPTALTASDLSTILGLVAVATSGSASDLGTGTLPIARIADGAVTLAKLANLAQATIIGRASGAGTGVPTALAGSDLSAIIGLGTAAFKNIGTSGDTIPKNDTGNTFSVQQTVSLSTTAAPLILESTESATPAGVAPNLVSARSVTGAANLVLGGHQMQGRSATGVSRVYARYYAQIVAATNAAENGQWLLDTIRAGTVTNELTVGGGLVLSNPSGGAKGVGSLNALGIYLNGTALATIATSGSASDLGTGTLPIARIADGAVTLAKLANLAQATIIGRASGAGTGVPTALSAAQVSTILGLATVATTGSAADLSGTLSASRIADGSLPWLKLGTLSGATIFARAALTSGAPAEITGTSLGQALNIGVSGIQWSTLDTINFADTAITLAKMANLTQATIIGRASGAGTGVPTALVASDLSTILGISKGVFTPSVVSSGGGAPTYTRQLGFYSVIADRVFFEIRIDLATLGTLAAGNLTISGLPATSESTSFHFSPVVFQASNLAATAITMTVAIITAGSTSISLFVYAAGTANNMTQAMLTGTASLNISGHYAK